ncbi:LysR substrate-binding domain-containing protein [Paludibacterium paludis]|uniref:LysR family transcriptional regulator n=1 Tax=Paludibacterium paludis TaxID=1225769 RepID=A0A918P1F4_9NEIS|nr:LysR substrate-binding domain-containing protein [Paludibacterium paludis]GGY12056.1 LysR family transcriptional regulator [Paludibacterium paludis]
MSRPDLPPLFALRAFEAAARLESFSEAAGELCLSSGAIAHQIRQLESWLGMPLFTRLTRGVRLTAAGRRYASQVTALLDALAEASSALRHEAHESRAVTVSAMPSLVTRWLMPRLPDFLAGHPGVEVRVLAAVKPSDLTRDAVDVAIRLGSGPYPGLQDDILFGEAFVALASPAFLARHPVPRPEALPGLPLLHDVIIAQIDRQTDWKKWLAAVGVPVSGRLPGSLFSHTYLTLEAAAAGQGVAIASRPLLGNFVSSGLLVELFGGLSVQGPYHYHLLRLPEAESRPQVKAFCAWVRDEAGKTTA